MRAKNQINGASVHADNGSNDLRSELYTAVYWPEYKILSLTPLVHVREAAGSKDHASAIV